MKKAKTADRLRFPEEEKKLPWLPLLLEAYSIIDKGVSLAVRERERGGERLACGKGCGACCRSQTDIPVYPLELVGIYWYVVEKLQGQPRAALKGQLSSFRNDVRCPFLLEGSCGIHPLRPIGCRQFNVFGRACGEDEDPYFSRRDDVLTPQRSYVDRAITVMLPFYGITAEKAKAEFVRHGLIHTHARVLQSLNWKELAGRIEEFDGRNTELPPKESASTKR